MWRTLGLTGLVLLIGSSQFAWGQSPREELERLRKEAEKIEDRIEELESKLKKQGPRKKFSGRPRFGGKFDKEKIERFKKMREGKGFGPPGFRGKFDEKKKKEIMERFQKMREMWEDPKKRKEMMERFKEMREKFGKSGFGPPGFRGKFDPKKRKEMMERFQKMKEEGKGPFAKGRGKGRGFGRDHHPGKRHGKGRDHQFRGKPFGRKGPPPRTSRSDEELRRRVERLSREVEELRRALDRRKE